VAARAVSLWWGDAPFWANATVVHGALLEIHEAPAVHPQRVRHFLVRVGHGFLFGAWLVPVQVLLQLGLLLKSKSLRQPREPRANHDHRWTARWKSSRPVSSLRIHLRTYRQPKNNPLTQVPARQG
jgi:hypothetical protein